MFRVGDILKGVDINGKNPYTMTSEGSIVTVKSVIYNGNIEVRVEKSGKRYIEDYNCIGMVFPVEPKYFVYYSINKGRG